MRSHEVVKMLAKSTKPIRGRRGRRAKPTNKTVTPALLLLEDRVVPTMLGQPLFPSDYPTNNTIANAPVSANSAAWVNAMAATRNHVVVNWGAYTPGSNAPLYSMPYNVVHSKDTVDYSMVKVYINNYPNESDLTGTDSSQGNRPYVLIPMPKANPQGMFIEGDSQKGADASRFTGGGSDSHFIVWDADTDTSYEMWETSRPSESALVPSGYYNSPAIANQWNAANEATWHMNADSFRTLGYTSGDAAGLPILNNIARPDEALPAADGGQSTLPVIDHALRFTLPRGLISQQFTYPASHVAGGGGTIPYGARFRLKNDAATNALIAKMGPQSQVIAHALQQYGLILADIGSSMFIQGAATSVDSNNNPIVDPTTGKPITWNMNDLTPDAVSGQYTVGLDSLPTTDFEAVDLTPKVTGLSSSNGPAGTTITLTGANFTGAAGHLSVLFVPPGNTPPFTSNGQVTTLKPGVVAASSVKVLDDQHLQVVVPQGSGTVDIQVLSGQLLDDTYNTDAENATAPIFGYGISAVNATDKFTYTAGNIAPTVTTQPTNQTVPIGQTASFTAVATGTPSPTVQWQYSTNSGATWKDIAGATSTTYLVNSTASRNGYEYRAVFTNAAGSATSNPVTLSLPAAAGPSITTQPANQTATAGQTVTFTASASGSPPPSVQWQVSTDGGATWTQIAGATSTKLTVPATAAQNGSQYRAVFSNNIVVNGDFEAATYSGSASNDILPIGWTDGPPGPASLSDLNVETVTNPATFLGPQSGTHYMRFQSPAKNGTRDCLYQDLNTVPGQSYTVSFWVAITSTSAGNTLGLTPVWDENKANQTTMSNGFYVSPSNTGPVGYQLFSFTETASTNVTRLDFHGVDAKGSILLDNVSVVATATTNAATLNVVAAAAPTITTQPSNQTVTASQTATFTAAAAGAPNPSVQWQLSTNNGATWTNITNATATTYKVANTTLSESGYEYRAVFTNSSGQATTNAATLTVNAAAPAITTQPSNQSVTAGQTATFTAAATGTPTPTVQWQLSTDNGTTWTNITGATATTYTLANSTTSQTGSEYRAVFTNSAGQATSNAATLTVNASSGSKTATFQQGVAGYTGGQDAGIDTQYAIYNGGNGVQYLNQPTLAIGTDSQGSVFETLIRFSSLSIPSNAIVSSSTLTLTIVDYLGGASVTGYYVNNSWSTTDGTIGWLNRGNGLTWATPGALGQGTDLVAGKSFTLPTTTANGPQTFTITLDASVVQNWIANPSADQGFLFVMNGPKILNVDTAENAAVASRPILSVTYQTPSAMPLSYAGGHGNVASSLASSTGVTSSNGAVNFVESAIPDVLSNMGRLRRIRPSVS